MKNIRSSHVIIREEVDECYGQGIWSWILILQALNTRYYVKVQLLMIQLGGERKSRSVNVH